jgi:hypothetical protein
LPWHAASTSLRGDCCRSRRKYRSGNAALVDWEAVTLPVDQATIARTETHNSVLAAIDASIARSVAPEHG